MKVNHELAYEQQGYSQSRALQIGSLFFFLRHDGGVAIRILSIDTASFYTRNGQE